MDSAVLMILFVSAGPVLFFFIVRARIAGKLLCWVLGDDRFAHQRLLKVQGNYVMLGEERFFVDPEAVRFVRYPSGWPTWMQQTVPASLYKSGTALPLNWTTLEPIGPTSSVELGAVLEPEWIKRLVKGTAEVGKVGTTGNRMTFFVTAGLGAVTLILVFYLISRMSEIEAMVRQIG